jgi:hypothetical protein
MDARRKARLGHTAIHIEKKYADMLPQEPEMAPDEPTVPSWVEPLAFWTIVALIFLAIGGLSFYAAQYIRGV